MPSPAPHPLVLVVDDNEQNRKLAREVLRADGLRTIEASTGAEAVQAATRNLPDVILLDLGLPDMDGVAVLRELRSREATAPIPVVAVTARRIVGEAEWFLDAGFSGCIEKPITVRDFAAQVRGHWRNAGQ